MPTASEHERWFSSGQLEQTLVATQRFLFEQDKIPMRRQSFGDAINASYLAAARRYLPKIDLRDLLPRPALVPAIVTKLTSYGLLVISYSLLGISYYLLV